MSVSFKPSQGNLPSGSTEFSKMQKNQSKSTIMRMVCNREYFPFHFFLLHLLLKLIFFLIGHISPTRGS